MTVNVTRVPMFLLPSTRSYICNIYNGPTKASRLMKKLKKIAVANPGRMTRKASDRKVGCFDMNLAFRDAKRTGSPV
jgi:hypothetical protein